MIKPKVSPELRAVILMAGNHSESQETMKADTGLGISRDLLLPSIGGNTELDLCGIHQ